MKQAFLIYGEDEVAISSKRVELLDQLVPRAQRAHNVSIFSSLSPSHPLQLAKVGSDIIAEISTVSLLEDAKRVVIVENPVELRRERQAKGASKTTKKKKAIARLANFIEKSLAQTSNTVIVIFHENGDKFRFINKTSPLFKAMQKVGDVIHCRSHATIFAFTDALIARNQNRCIETYRKMIDNGKSPNSIFSVIVRQVRFLLQAKMLNAPNRKPDIEELMPAEKGLSLLAQHQFVAGKVKNAAPRFTFQELSNAMKRLHKIDVTLHPSQNDLYVPDINTVMELFLIKFCQGISQ